MGAAVSTGVASAVAGAAAVLSAGGGGAARPRGRRRGVRSPSMRAIEKEAYRWADEHIDNLETACYYVQQQLQVHTRVQQLRLLLQIDQRRLTASEEQYLAAWIGMGFGNEAIQLAYERT